MMTPARSSLAALAALTLLAGCEWQVEADKAPQGLAIDHSQDGGEQCPDVTDLPGQPQGGYVFVAQLQGV